MDSVKKYGMLMQTITEIMNNKERKTRKRWLMVNICLMSLLAFNIIVNVLTDAPEAAFYLPISRMLVLFSLWYCAYKEHGNKFLTFWLILGIFGILREIVEIAHQPIDIVSVIDWIITVSLSIWFYVLSWKLRAINKKIKTPKQSESSRQESIEKNNA